jgi:hypothetical protein
MTEDNKRQVSVERFARKWRIRRLLFLIRYCGFTLLPFVGWPVIVTYFIIQDEWVGAIIWLVLYPTLLTHFAGWLLEILVYVVRYPSVSINPEEWRIHISDDKIQLEDSSIFCMFNLTDIVKIRARQPKDEPEIEMPTLLEMLELENGKWLPIPVGAEGASQLSLIADEYNWIEQDYDTI